MSSFLTHSDAKLLLLISEGNQKAFDELYNRYWSRVLGVAIHKLNDVQEAEEIVQDIFLSLWKRRRDLLINSELECYLMVCVKYRVIKYLSRQRQKRLYEKQQLTGDLLDDSTQEYLNFSDLKRQLEILVRRLPETCRLVYQMNKESGMSYKEISKHLGISEKAVDGHLFRAKKNLKTGIQSFLSIYLL
ncbi:RNA polymerase sigma factor [Desertivirga xinjiangensis]|uniref:RNA polymerase sigma factor n=1 Tax=Desertivirga xinjiangensis TaxID=539206 RepID=UPI0021090751|nr:RNA polymerase sigma-70 factor [Pedobacter xinjiangensis]